MEQQNPITPTTARDWKGRLPIAGTDLPLPSGNVARVRALSPNAFLSSGVIPDPLSDIVAKAIHSKKGLPPAKIKEIADDPDKVQSTLELFDRVLAYVMVAPQVSMPPPCIKCGEFFNVDERHDPENGSHLYQEGPRDPDVLYADEVDIKDKVFVFQFALTGVRDLESFREVFPAGLGVVLDVEDVQPASQ